MTSTKEPFDTIAQPSLTAEYKAEAGRLSALLEPLVEPLQAAIGAHSEVVLHNLALLPNSVVAIAGHLSGRQAGSPASDLALTDMRSSSGPDHRIGYRLELPGGITCRSSTLFLNGSQPRPVVALCINADVRALATARDILNQMTAFTAGEPVERVDANVSALADRMLNNTIAATGVPVERMSKAHKIDVVHALDQQGFFLIREAATQAGTALKVSRHTIYNYLATVPARPAEHSSAADPS